jgi:trans-aconitate methyltransferase
MWNKIKDIEEAKRCISNPTYVDTGRFIPDVVLFNDIDLRNKIVIDFGCGIGRNAKYILTKKPLHLTCYDYPNMLQMAKEYIGESEIAYISYPITNLLKGAGEADYILADIVLQHIKYDELRKEVLPALVELLAPFGALIVCSRGFTDDNHNIWEILKEFFILPDEIDNGDKTKRHQNGILLPR